MRDGYQGFQALDIFRFDVQDLRRGHEQGEPRQGLNECISFELSRERESGSRVGSILVTDLHVKNAGDANRVGDTGKAKIG